MPKSCQLSAAGVGIRNDDASRAGIDLSVLLTLAVGRPSVRAAPTATAAPGRVNVGQQNL